MTTTKKNQKPEGRPTPPGSNMGENADNTSKIPNSKKPAPTSQSAKHGTGKSGN